MDLGLLAQEPGRLSPACANPRLRFTRPPRVFGGLARLPPSTALVTIQPAFTDAERLALAGFLAGYRGLTREACTLDLRPFTGWCRLRSLSLFSVRRADIETFARELEAKDRARATVTRRPCTIARPSCSAAGLGPGHRTLAITRKGGKVVTIPLAPRTARAIDPAAGERTEGPLFVAADGRRLDQHGAARIVRRVTRRAQIAKDVSPHPLRHSFIAGAAR